MRSPCLGLPECWHCGHMTLLPDGLCILERRVIPSAGSSPVCITRPLSAVPSAPLPPFAEPGFWIWLLMQRKTKGLTYQIRGVCSHMFFAQVCVYVNHLCSASLALGHRRKDLACISLIPGSVSVVTPSQKAVEWKVPSCTRMRKNKCKARLNKTNAPT